MVFDPVSGLLELGNTLIQRVFPDPAIAANAKLELIKMQQNGELQMMAGQQDINKIEAANQNLFVSGWRPAIGWVCATAMLYQFVARPLLQAWYSHLSFPALDDVLWQLLFGMLGLGSLRTIEKIKGVAQ